MGVYTRPNIVTNGLVLNLDAANIRSYPGTGTTWTDLSGNNNTGTLINGPTFSRDGGGSIIFDGSNDYGQLSNTSSLNFGSGNFTINIAFKPNSVQSGGNFPAVIHKSTGDWTNNGVGTGGINGWILYFIGGVYTFGLANGSTTQNSISYPASVANDNTWKNLCIVVSSNNITIYNNGTPAGNTTRTLLGSTNTTQNVFLSMWNTSQFGFANRYLNNILSLVSIYNRALSASEIRQNYNALKSRFNLS